MGDSLLPQSTTPWQTSIKNTKDKWLHVWHNNLFTDITLQVGPGETSFHCHRILLIMHSPVFETMLSHRWNDSSSSKCQTSEVSLPDEQVEIFKLFLEFIYTGTVNVTDVDLLVSLLLLGKKYLCTSLIDKCIESLKDSLSVSNVMNIYQASEMLDEYELHKATEDYILHNASTLISAGEISKMNRTDLCKLLKNDELNVSEIILFNAVYSWGKSECTRMGLDSSDNNNICEVLKDVIQLIRFTNMSAEDFSCQVVPKSILPLEDTVTIFRFLTTPQDKRSEVQPELDLKFNTTKRSLSYFVYNLRRLKGHGYDFGSKWQNFCFQTDRNVKIISLGFFRAVQQDAVLEVKMKIGSQDMNEIYAEGGEDHGRTTNGEDVFHVKFKQPVLITKDLVHTISYNIKGCETFYKPSAETVIVANCGAEGKVTFKFTEALNDSDLDQVPEICFRL